MKRSWLFLALLVTGKACSDLGGVWAIVLYAVAFVAFEIYFTRTWVERSEVAKRADNIDAEVDRLKASFARYMNVTKR